MNNLTPKPVACMTVCTAPLGANILNMPDDVIANAMEINNDYNLVLFNVQLPCRLTRDRNTMVPTFAITDALGVVKVFGLGTRKIIGGALSRIDRSAVSLANSILK